MPVPTARLIRLGAIACFVLSVFAQLSADLHGFVVILGTVPGFRSPHVIADIYSIIGLVVEPFLIVSILCLALSFRGVHRATGNRWARAACLAALVYLAARIFWAGADLNFAFAVRASGDAHGGGAAAGLGIGALAGGLTAGLGLTPMLLLFFRTERLRLGFSGSLLVLASMILGMTVKILSMWFLPAPLTVAFMLCMAGKSIGLCLIGTSLTGLAQRTEAMPAAA